MKIRPGAPLDAMGRPNAAAGIEMAGLLGMPIARGKDRKMGLFEFLDIAVQHGDNSVPFHDRKRAAGAEIILHVDNDKSVFAFHRGLL